MRAVRRGATVATGALAAPGRCGVPVIERGSGRGPEGPDEWRSRRDRAGATGPARCGTLLAWLLGRTASTTSCRATPPATGWSAAGSTRPRGPSSAAHRRACSSSLAGSPRRAGSRRDAPDLPAPRPALPELRAFRCRGRPSGLARSRGEPERLERTVEQPAARDRRRSPSRRLREECPVHVRTEGHHPPAAGADE